MNFLNTNKTAYLGLLLVSGLASQLSVHAATTITDINLSDIVINGIDGTTIGWAHDGVGFSRSVQNGSTGSGTFRRLYSFGDTNNDINGNDNIAEGYNYDGTQTRPYDQGTAQGFDPALTVGQLPIVTIDGNLYVEFIWDINESGGNGSYLSLDRVEIYTNPSTTPVFTSDRFTSGPDMNYADVSKLDDDYGQGAGQLIWSLDLKDGNGDLTEDGTVFNKSGLSGGGPGSGAGDMFLYVPWSLFTSSGMNDKVYLYTQAGREGSIGNAAFDESAGFEEWSINSELPTASSLVPEPSTVIGGIACVLFGAVRVGRRYLQSKAAPAAPEQQV